MAGIYQLRAQVDTLPNFSLTNTNGSIQIQWINTYKNIIQLNIQRSKENNKNFITIHSFPSPPVKSYKYTDKTAPNDSCFYRLFILYESTNYEFTKQKRPVKKNDTIVISQPLKIEAEKKEIIPVILKKEIVIKKSSEEKKDTIAIIPPPQKKTQIIDTNKAFISLKEPRNLIREEVILHIQKHVISTSILKDKFWRSDFKVTPISNTGRVWKPSSFVYTGDDGNIVISVPDANKREYSLTLLKEEGRPLFMIPKITQSAFRLDKSTFLKSGWYYFELREAGKVVERNKFLITRDN